MMDSLYSALDVAKRQIRLITILPTKDKSERVECNLSIASLEDGVQFDALSYRWGSTANPVAIAINGREIEVTKNLAQALKRFQQTGYGSIVPIWIDAVCINQPNISERNAQVSMMGDIYKQASTVHVWLGGPDTVDKAGMDALRELAEDPVRGDNWPSPDDPLRVQKLNALESLLGNEYWRRTWILQEISFSEDIAVHSHSERVSLKSQRNFLHVSQAILVDLYNKLGSGRNTPEEAARTAQALEPMAMAAWCNSIRHLIAAGDPAFLRIPQVLFLRFRHSLATDPRDKIYGMLNLLPNVFEDIRPDYSKTMREVYQDATVELIRKSNDLELLSQACSQSGDLPSWVPDFRVPSRFPTSPSIYWNSCSSGTCATLETIATRPGVLNLKACRIDHIAHIARGGGVNTEHSFFEIRLPILNWFALFYRHADLATHHVEETARDFVFWRAVCGGSASRSSTFENEHVTFCQQIMSYAGADSPEAKIRGSDYKDFAAYLSQLVRENDFFITANGYAGLIPRNSGDIGDDIYILAGGPVPFCVRESRLGETKVYTLRAPCFVENQVTSSQWRRESKQGIMDGGIVLQKAKCQVDDREAIDKVFQTISIA